MSRLRRLIAPPSFDDEEQAQRALIFHRVVLTTMMISSPVLALIPVVQPEVAVRAFSALTVVSGLGLILLELNRRGHTVLASKMMVAGLITLVTILGFTAGGVRSPGVTMYFIFVLMGGLLLGQRAGIRLAVLCGSLSLGMVVLERNGLMPEPWAPYKPETFWLLNCLYLGLTLALLRIATDALKRGLQRVEAELKERRAAEREREEADRRRRESEKQLRQSQKMEALGTLAGGIAHDFNNILVAIIGNAELALGEVDANNPARSALERIQTAGARAADIVKRIMLFSRRQEAAQRIIQLLPVVEEAIKLLRVTLPKDIMVRTAYRSGLPLISGDPAQLYQVTMNLATNAAHSMSETGGDLSVEIDVVDVTEAEKSRSPDLREGQYVRVVVRDTGIGMTPETMERVFEPFFTTKGPGGSGLGLSVVHGIVQDHRGAITVESELGKGSTFAVYFPAAESQRAVSVPVAPHGNGRRGKGERIMYVDDDEALLSVMERTLGVCGYRCQSFSDPVVAVTEFSANPDAWDAVITDLAMPAMSGLDLAEHLRSIRPDVRIALTTGHIHDIERVSQVGISVRLQKPYSIDTVGAAMYELLGQPTAAR